ncbi:MAG: histidine kinase, partial [Bacteroidales bacterium]
MKIKIFEGNKIRIFLHLLAWLILLALPLYFIKRWQLDKDFVWLTYINLIINGVIFYINYLILVPRYFFNSKKLKYYLSVIVLIGCFYFVSDYSNKVVFRYNNERNRTEQSENRHNQPGRTGPPPGGRLIFGRPPFRQMHLFNYGFTSVFLVFFSLGLRVLERHSQTEKMQKEMEKEKLNSELAFLKNQVSPHFFFNTLNNIYSLINISAEDSQKAILKLSKLMRYLLYESEQGDTKLSNEIEFMNNYIDLMKLRMSEKVNLTVSFPEHYNDMAVPPLLFIPFIENAFKHGVSYRSNSFIRIEMEVKQKSITFRCDNSIANGNGSTAKEHSGIGLENVSKRLNLL